jgi:hypothetical protein
VVLTHRQVGICSAILSEHRRPMPRAPEPGSPRQSPAVPTRPGTKVGTPDLASATVLKARLSLGSTDGPAIPPECQVAARSTRQSRSERNHLGQRWGPGSACHARPEPSDPHSRYSRNWSLVHQPSAISIGWGHIYQPTVTKQPKLLVRGCAVRPSVYSSTRQRPSSGTSSSLFDPRCEDFVRKRWVCSGGPLRVA